MKKEKTVRRKRPPVTGTLIGVRLQPPELARLDGWIAKQDSAFNRPEAIRRFIELGLGSDNPTPAESARARKAKPATGAKKSARATKAAPMKTMRPRRP
jgi:hypothetical protein